MFRRLIEIIVTRLIKSKAREVLRELIDTGQLGNMSTDVVVSKLSDTPRYLPLSGGLLRVYSQVFVHVGGKWIDLTTPADVDEDNEELNYVMTGR